MSGRTVNDGTGDQVSLADGVTRYDLVLALIPLSLAFGVLGAVSLGADPLTGLRGGSVVALAATAYGLFGSPPEVEAPSGFSR
ncbi:MAG: hypothetical protein ABEJ58_09720 [Halodesulfurarchaeum sp.]